MEKAAGWWCGDDGGGCGDDGSSFKRCVCVCVVCVSGTPITFELPSLENLRERAERSIVNESFQLSIIWLKYSLKEEKDRMNTVGANLIIMRTKDSSSD